MQINIGVLFLVEIDGETGAIVGLRQTDGEVGVASDLTLMAPFDAESEIIQSGYGHGWDQTTFPNVAASQLISMAGDQMGSSVGFALAENIQDYSKWFLSRTSRGQIITYCLTFRFDVSLVSCVEARFGNNFLYITPTLYKRLNQVVAEFK